jgi:hypothetical protein
MATLFKILLDIGLVPYDFGVGVTTPIPKYKGIKNKLMMMMISEV